MADQPFAYDESETAALISTISPTRFSTYRQHVGSDAEALQIYTWNTAAAAALYGPLQTLEVTLRNAVHDALCQTHGSAWFDNGQLLRQAEQGKGEAAVQQLHDFGKKPTAGRVIAELPFGFWVALFANAYDTTIWRTDLHRIFSPRVSSRRGLHDALDRLRTLRNRIAHHEPIFQRMLQDDYNRICNITGFLSTPTLSWLRHHSRVPSVLAVQPDAVLEY